MVGVRTPRRREASIARDLREQIFAEVAYQKCNILGFLTLWIIRQIRTAVPAVSVCEYANPQLVVTSADISKL